MNAKELTKHKEYQVFKQELLTKRKTKLETKHPGRSARDYMTSGETKSYLANLKAAEDRSKATRNQYTASGFDPVLELRRALDMGL